MKAKKTIIVVLFVLLTAQIASAYYCPSTGRWLSRDPIGEPGFQEITQTRISASLPGGYWIQRDSSTANGLGLNQCPSCKKLAAQKVKMATNEPNLFAFVQNDPIEKIDAFGLWATLDTSGYFGCKDHDKDIQKAWQAAIDAMQHGIDKNVVLEWDNSLLDCMSQNTSKISISCSSCNLFRDFDCEQNKNTANVSYASGTIRLCSSFFSSSPCQQAEILATEASKLSCGISDVGGNDSTETKFAHWLNSQLCNK